RSTDVATLQVEDRGGRRRLCCWYRDVQTSLPLQQRLVTAFASRSSDIKVFFAVGARGLPRQPTENTSSMQKVSSGRPEVKSMRLDHLQHWWRPQRDRRDQRPVALASCSNR